MSEQPETVDPDPPDVEPEGGPPPDDERPGPPHPLEEVPEWH